MSTPGLSALGLGQSPPGSPGDWPREAGCTLPGPGDAVPALGSTDSRAASDVFGQTAARCPEEGPLWLVCAHASLAESCLSRSIQPSTLYRPIWDLMMASQAPAASTRPAHALLESWGPAGDWPWVAPSVWHIPSTQTVRRGVPSAANPSGQHEGGCMTNTHEFWLA